MSKKISRSIVGFNVVKSQDDNATTEADNISYIHEKVERPEKLVGATYKVKTPESEHAFYITMNDIILNEDTEFEIRRPFEVFINTKNMNNYEWVVALTLLISAVFRKGGDVTFIVKELKSVFSPAGGYFKKGHGFMPSLVAEIGLVIEKHMRMIGLIDTENTTAKHNTAAIDNGDFPENAAFCMSCHTNAMVLLDNCMTCLNCSESKCS